MCRRYLARSCQTIRARRQNWENIDTKRRIYRGENTKTILQKTTKGHSGMFCDISRSNVSHGWYVYHFREYLYEFLFDIKFPSIYIYLHKIRKLFVTGSAKLALEVLVDSGCKPINIMFLNLICAPEGLEALRNNYPEVRIRNKYYNYEKL